MLNGLIFFACGIGFNRIAKPVFAFAIVMAVVSFVINETVVPVMTKQSKDLALWSFSQKNVPDGKHNFTFEETGGNGGLKRLFYVEYCENAWLLLRMKNIAAHLAEKESNCKYYFIDNGILNLFLVDKDTALLENLVALALFRKFGYDVENERVFFYQDKVEVDFYIPEEEWAVQVSYTLKDEETYEREVSALKKLPKVLSCRRRTIITYDESDSISDANGCIEVLPFWKWLLE